MLTYTAVLTTSAAALAAAAPASAAVQPVAEDAREVDALAGHLVWVKPATASSKSQIVLDGEPRAAMAGGRQPDLGTDSRGRVIVVFIRHGDVWVFDPVTRRARRLRATHRGLTERHPTVSRGRVGWVLARGSGRRAVDRLVFAKLHARRPQLRSVPGGGAARRVEGLELSGRVLAISTSQRNLRADETGPVRVQLVRPGRTPVTALAGVNSVNQETTFAGLALTSSWVYVAQTRTDISGTTTVIRRAASSRRSQRLVLGEDFIGQENAPRRRVDSVAVAPRGALLMATSGTGPDRIEREASPAWR